MALCLYIVYVFVYTHTHNTHRDLFVFSEWFRIHSRTKFQPVLEPRTSVALAFTAPSACAHTKYGKGEV